MKRSLRVLIGTCAIGALSLGASADQGPQLSRVMRAKLGHLQAILGAVVTSNWAVLDRESRALALVVRDPAWGTALIQPEYLRQSDAFQRALQGSHRGERETESRIRRRRPNRADLKLRALPRGHDPAPHREIAGRMALQVERLLGGR